MSLEDRDYMHEKAKLRDNEYNFITSNNFKKTRPKRKDNLVLKIALGIVLGFFLMSVLSLLFWGSILGGLKSTFNKETKKKTTTTLQPVPAFNSFQPTQIIPNYTAPKPSIKIDNKNYTTTEKQNNNGTWNKITMNGQTCWYKQESGQMIKKCE